MSNGKMGKKNGGPSTSSVMTPQQTSEVRRPPSENNNIDGVEYFRNDVDIVQLLLRTELDSYTEEEMEDLITNKENQKMFSVIMTQAEFISIASDLIYGKIPYLNPTIITRLQSQSEPKQNFETQPQNANNNNFIRSLMANYHDSNFLTPNVKTAISRHFNTFYKVKNKINKTGGATMNYDEEDNRQKLVTNIINVLTSAINENNAQAKINNLLANNAKKKKSEQVNES